MLCFKGHISLGVSLLVLFSCTIVKDSDVTSISQLNSLSLKSFEIVQNSQAGNSTVQASLKYDSAVNSISGSTGAHISRIKGFSLPALGNYKMKLKCGSNAATEIKIGYKDNGMPNAFSIYKGDSLVEIYKFYYNTANQLIKFVADVNPMRTKSLHIKDTIVYPTSSTYPNSIIRKSSDPSLAGTYTMSSCNQCNNASVPSIVSFSQKTYGFSTSNCNDTNNFYPYACGGVYTNNNSGGSSGNNNNQLSFQNNFSFDKTLQTTLTSVDSKDIYYFHPIQILKDVVPEGSFYFWFYSVDWYQTSGSSFNNNDMVKLNFNYGK